MIKFTRPVLAQGHCGWQCTICGVVWPMDHRDAAERHDRETHSDPTHHNPAVPRKER